MAEQVGFFQFGTNVDETADTISAAMRRIQSSVSGGLGPAVPGRTAADTGALSGLFSSIRADIAKGEADVARLMRDFGTSANPDPVAFKQQLADTIRGRVGNISGIMANELAKVPEATAGRLNAKEIAVAFGDDYIRGLTQYARDNRGMAGEALKGINLAPSGLGKDLAADVALSAASRGVGYGAESDQLAALINRMRAENMVAKDLSSDVPTALEKQTGFDALTERIRQEQIGFQTKGKGDNAVEVPYLIRTEGLAKELAEVVRLEKDADATGQRLQRTREQQAAVTQQLAAAEALLADHYQRGAGRLLGPDGQVLRTTTAGVAPEENPIRIQETRDAVARMQAEAENSRRLLDNIDNVTAAGGYHVLGDRQQGAEVYKLSAAGAERVQDEYKVERALQAQDAVLARQVAKEIALAEAAEKRALHTTQSQSGVLGGFLGRFHRGDQDFATNLGGQIASAAAFSFAYGSLFALQAVLRDTMAEFLDYQDSVTDLEVATRSADLVTADWVETLSGLSRLSGSNVGAALDAAARGVRAFTEAGDSPERIREVGNAVAEASTKLSLIADKPMTDATGDVVATGSAFGLDPDQINQVVDAVANAKRNVGGDANQISQGLSLFAITAQEAGYNLNEAAAVMGLVQARTDQSGQAIATRMSRIFQIITGSTGKNLATDLGVDADASVKEQIESYAKIYSNPDTSDAIRDRITSGLGGTANLRELLPLLQENATLQKAYKEALTNAGQGTDEFNRKSENLVGTLKKIKGDLSNIQVGLANSGLFDFVGGMLYAIEPGLHALDLMISGLNELTSKVPGLQSLLGTMVSISLAAKATSTIRAANGIFGLGGGAKTASAVVDTTSAAAATRRAATENAATAATGRRIAAENAATVATARRTVTERLGLGSGAVATRFPGLATLGNAAMSTPFLATAAVVGVMATIGKIMDDNAIGKELETDTTASYRAYSRADGSGASLDTAAQDVRAIAGEIEGLQTAAGAATERRDRTAEILEGRAAGLDALADRVNKEVDYANALQQTSVFGNGAIETTAQLAEGMQAIATDGGTALTQIRALRRALLTPPPDLPKYQPAEAAAAAFTSTTGLLPEAAKNIEDEMFEILKRKAEERADSQFIPTGGSTSDPFGETTPSGVPKATDLLTHLDLEREEVLDVYEQVRKRMVQKGMDPRTGLTDTEITELQTIVANSLPFESLGEIGQEMRDELLRLLVEQAELGMQKNKKLKKAGVPPALLNDMENITKGTINTLLNPNEEAGWAGWQANSEAALAMIPANDDGTMMEAELKSQAQFLRTLSTRLQENTGGKHKTLELLLGNAEAAYAEVAVERIQDLREAAESRQTSNKALREVRLSFAKRAINKAAGNPNLIESVMESLDRTTIQAVIDYMRVAVNTARMAYQHAARIHNTALQVMRAAGEGAGLVMPSQEDMAAAGKALERKQEKLREVLDVYNGPANVTEKIAKLPDESSSSDDGKTAKEKAEEARARAEERAQENADRIGAQAAARAARLGGGMASARAAIVTAKAQLDIAKKGTAEYYNALASFYQAQWQLKDAMLAYKGSLLALEGDNTDPVEQARDALTLARQRLAQARAADERAAARVEVQDSEVALQQAKWDQKLSDMQIAEQLGRISYATYVRYLERESQRMHNIHGKTRAQIDRMNEIDLALKDATQSMEGQFNLGDINTRGFVYQVRRFAEEARSGLTSELVNRSSVINNNQTISINGADTRAVRAILREMLGDNVPQRRTAAPRRR